MKMGKRLGTRVKTARTQADLTQEQLSRIVRTLSASDISKIERGEKEPTQEDVRRIAKATGVTQKSLLEGSSTSSGTRSTSRKSSMQVTATERRLVELYREADGETKMTALKVLRGGGMDVIAENVIGSAFDAITGKKNR
jgi:transcriptional regulator with XRE-family HTH domain